MSDADARSVARWWGWLALGSVPAIAFPDVLAHAASLPAQLASVGTFSLSTRFIEARVIFPIVSVSAAVLLMSPGMMLTLASRRAQSFASWVLLSLPATLMLVVLLAAVAPHVGGPALSGRRLAIVTLLVSLVCALAAVLIRRYRGMAGVVAIPGIASVTIVAPLALLALLAPKFLWEDFNGDGAHAFEASRLLLRQSWPFFSERAGDMAQFPGITSMLFAYPNAWFMRLFGATEAAVRVPFALYLAVLSCGVHALAEVRRGAVQPWVTAAIWSSLVVYTVTIGFSASYSPYNADFALPATQDTLLVVCFLGFMYAMVQGAWRWAIPFGVLTYTSLPSGLLLVAFWAVAEMLVMGRRSWRGASVAFAIIVGSIVAAAVVARLIAGAGAAPPGAEYGLRQTLSDLMVLYVTDWRRVLYAVVPAGIFPTVALLLWRRQDDVARRVTLVTAAYCGFFFVQSRISLHHFVPAMLLPLVVAARVVPIDVRTRRRWVAGCLVAAGVALVLSAPDSWRVSRVARPVAAAMIQRVGSYDAGDPAVFEAATLLGALFPADWDARVPDSTYGGSMLVWLHYMPAKSPDSSTNYLLAPGTDAVLAGMTTIARGDGVALHQRSDTVLANHRAIRPVGLTSAPIYRIPKRALFEGRRGRGRVDVAEILQRVGVDVRPLLGNDGPQ